MTDETKPPVTLDFIARQLERVIEEQAAMRARLDTLTTVVLRITNTMQDVLTELHAVHVEFAGFDRRLRRLEERVP
jgi:hypothetical protein